MTADEEGLPPLDPDEIRAPEYNTAAQVMKWLVQTVWKLDITDDQRAALDQVFKDNEFQKIAHDLETGLKMGLDDPEAAYGAAQLPPPIPMDETEVQEWMNEVFPKEDNTE